MVSQNSFNNKRRGNRGRSSLRSASNRDADKSKNTPNATSTSAFSSSNSHSVSKTSQSQGKTKRPRKYASSSLSTLAGSGEGGSGSSYAALLNAFTKKTHKPKAAEPKMQIDSDDSDEDYEENRGKELSQFNNYETSIIPDDDIGEEEEDIEDAVDPKAVRVEDAEAARGEVVRTLDGEDLNEDYHEDHDEEGFVSNDEFEENPYEDDEDGDEGQDEDFDEDDERTHVEGYLHGTASKPTETDFEFDEEDQDNEKTEEDQVSDTYMKHFQDVDASVYETLPPPPTVTLSAKPTINLTSFSAPNPSASETIEWETNKYTKFSSFPNKSLLYTPPKPHDELYKEVKSVPELPSSSPSSLFSSFNIRPKIQETWESENPRLTTLQKDLAPSILDYQDLLFPAMTVQNHAELRRLYCLHILNHIYKAQRTIYNNDLQLRLPDTDADLEFRDQGFTKPKVLIVLPTKDACYKVLTQLAVMSNLQEINNKKRFKTAFYDRDTPPSSRPEDFIELFSGNSDDMFCLGIKITMKSMKFYANFYDADILVASPLGLDLILGKEGGEKKPEYDFLSSIEIAIVDQADAMIMQNWDHVEHIFNKLNVTPKDAHGCDFSRLKPWFTEEKAAYFRQSIILSQYLTPEMNSLFSNKCFNLAGKLKIRPVYDGVMGNLSVGIAGASEGNGHQAIKVRQTFSRLVAPRAEKELYESDPSKDPDLRFTYFTTVILPSLLRGADDEGILIYISSYMDFTRIRNYLDAKDGVSFTSINEYTSVSDMNRAREFFSSGRTKILLYTERFHHFRRYEIKGCFQVIFYGLPENPLFYREVTRNLIRTVVTKKLDPEMVKVRAIYSQWDAFKLERIVGTKRVAQMLKGTSETYEFK